MSRKIPNVVGTRFRAAEMNYRVTAVNENGYVQVHNETLSRQLTSWHKWEDGWRVLEYGKQPAKQVPTKGYAAFVHKLESNAA